jgi:hypothetical protein
MQGNRAQVSVRTEGKRQKLELGYIPPVALSPVPPHHVELQRATGGAVFVRWWTRKFWIRPTWRWWR